jgi:hypothetical protein
MRPFFLLIYRRCIINFHKSGVCVRIFPRKKRPAPALSCREPGHTHVAGARCFADEKSCTQLLHKSQIQVHVRAGLYIYESVRSSWGWRGLICGAAQKQRPRANKLNCASVFYYELDMNYWSGCHK